MFKIIGADGQVYGPVGADQIRTWIMEGRCNAATQAQADGTAEWTSLARFPEFAALFPSPAPPALPPIGSGSASSESSSRGPSADWLLARDYQLDIGACLGQGWNLLFGNFWPAVGITFLSTLLMGVPFVNFAVQAGILHYFIKLARGEKAVLEDLFEGFSDRFLHLVVAGLLVCVLTGLSCILLVLPAIYLGIAWQFSLPLVLEKKLDFWVAMELSRKMVSKHWFTVFFFTILGSICSSLGALGCLVGIYFTIPWGLASIACAYRQIFEPATGAPGGSLQLGAV